MLINFLSVRRVRVKVRGVIVGEMNKILWILHLAKRQTVCENLIRHSVLQNI